MHIKAEGMTQFDIFHVFVENSMNRDLLFLSSTQTSLNLKFIQKCPCLCSLKNKFHSELKTIFDHSLEGS